MAVRISRYHQQYNKGFREELRKIVVKAVMKIFDVILTPASIMKERDT